tara:strand:- start:305 stop:712 length:408 start_codon:yes stop_codon:yes gene_type:complete
MNEMDLLTKIEGLEKAIKEHVEQADQYKTTLADTKQQLVDYNKPEITPMMMDGIHDAVEKAVEGFDFSNTDNYEFEYGMEYDGKVYCESVGLQCAYELTEQIVNNVFKLFKEAECPEDEPTADQLNTQTVENKII